MCVWNRCGTCAAALLILAISAIVPGAGMAKPVFHIGDYGAKGDGMHLDTTAIQNAIDACGGGVGGIVLVPDGRYLTGTIVLKSHVELRLEKGAVLLGSTDLKDYSDDIQGAVEAPAFNKCLLYAENADQITLSGSGCIDGNGSETNFPVRVDGDLGDRPMLLRFVGCQKISMSGVTLKNSASWCCHLVDCEDVRIDGVTVDSRVNENNDGFDLDGCNNVTIERCRLRTGDDSICPKSTARISENIVVKKCEISSGTAAFKCGTSSRGGFRDISVTDCRLYDCRMGAIKLLVVDGGIMEDILISDIVMENVEGPLFIRLGNRGRIYDKPTEQIYSKEAKPEGATVGRLRGIRIRNVDAKVVGDDKSRQGILITGIPDHRIENVELENMRIHFSGGGTAWEADREVPEDIARYPEQYFFGVLPSSGLYLRHVSGIVLRNINLSWERPDERPAVICEDVDRLRIYEKSKDNPL